MMKSCLDAVCGQNAGKPAEFDVSPILRAGGRTVKLQNGACDAIGVLLLIKLGRFARTLDANCGKVGQKANEGNMNSDSPSLSVLVPAYNEQDTIARVLQKLLLLPVNLKEVIVVDDGSSDQTAAEVRRAAAGDQRVRLFQLEKNRGKTAAIAYALEQCAGDVAVIQDADLEYDPAEIPEVIQPILEGNADVVYGSRFVVRRAARVLYFYHYLANRSLTFMCNLLTNRNMTDIETGYKAFRAGVIKPLKLSSRGFGLEVEITAMICKTKARTYEVPISYYGRTYEEGKKIFFTDGLAALWYIFYFNIIKSRLPSGRRYVRAVNDWLAEHK
jgi:glycosyltransferase involved in cell wall biosynthesis